MPSKKVSMRASMANQTSHFGIMGGLYNRKISGSSSANRATSRLTIPAGADAGLRYMKMHNLLSRNPLGSGGVGRMFNIRPRGSGLGSVKPTTDNLGDSLGSEVHDHAIPSPTLVWKKDVGGSLGKGSTLSPDGATLSPDGKMLFVGSNDGNVYALKATDGSVVWKYPTGDVAALAPPPTPTLSPDGKMLFVGSDNGNIYALTTADASLLWKSQTDSPVYAPPIVSSDGTTLFVGTYDDGEVYALKAIDGSVLWHYSTGAVDGLVLSADDATLFVGSSADDGGAVRALKTANALTPSDRLVWKYDTRGGVSTSPTLSADGAMLFVSSYSDSVYALSATNGLVVWKYPTGYYVRSSPTLSPDGGTLFVGSDDHFECSIDCNDGIYALTTADASLVWQYQTGSYVSSSPTLSPDGKTLFVGSADTNVYALKTADGSVVWRYPTGGQVLSSPTLSADGATLFVGSDDGNVYALSTGIKPKPPKPICGDFSYNNLCDISAHQSFCKQSDNNICYYNKYDTNTGEYACFPTQPGVPCPNQEGYSDGVKCSCDKSCGSFILGNACKLGTEPKQPDSDPLGYVKLIVDNIGQDACISACEARNEPGCCWHDPNSTNIDTVCQWIKGGTSYYVGESGVRSSTNCVTPSAI